MVEAVQEDVAIAGVAHLLIIAIIVAAINFGIVSARREGKWMHYRLVMPQYEGAAQVFRQTLAWLKTDKAMQADRARLTRTCCALEKFSALEGAPLPVNVECVAC